MKIELSSAETAMARWALVKFAAGATDTKTSKAAMELYEKLGGAKRKTR